MMMQAMAAGLVFLILAGATTAPTTVPSYITEPGPAQVAVLRGVILHDAQRNKDLEMTVVLPVEGGPYPVIIFSHGAGGAPWAYLWTLKLWASRGYVCLAPVHQDSLLLRHQRDAELIGEMQQAVREALTDRDAWVNRAKDITLIIDHLADLPAIVPPLKDKIDPSHIGIAGHSFGAQTAVLLAGATIDLSPSDTQRGFADPRIKAAILMSAQGPGQMGFTEHSWDNIKIPLMVMTGTRDMDSATQGSSWRLRPYELAPGGDKYAVLVRDAHHLSFASGIGPAESRRQPFRRDRESDAHQKEILSNTELPTLPFWDAYLKDDLAAKAYLQSGAIGPSSHGDIQMWAK